MKGNSMLKTIFAYAAVTLFVASMLSACNTVEGAGKDIQNGGKDIQNSAERNK
jgi:entericidin B